MLSTFLLWLCTWHAFDLLWMLSKEQSLFFMIWFRSRILFPTFLQTITFFSKSAVCQTSIFGCDWGQLILKLLLIEIFSKILFWNGISIHTWYLSFFYTNTFWGLEILLSKVRKFPTKICLRQNSVNYTLCVNLPQGEKNTHCV